MIPKAGQGCQSFMLVVNIKVQGKMEGWNAEKVLKIAAKSPNSIIWDGDAD